MDSTWAIRIGGKGKKDWERTIICRKEENPRLSEQPGSQVHVCAVSITEAVKTGDFTLLCALSISETCATYCQSAVYVSASDPVQSVVTGSMEIRACWREARMWREQEQSALPRPLVANRIAKGANS